ncbi:MAG: proline dehydrogenase family protein, partial [Ignavibacteria bacterium]|nr:proline dehydrogenase family protein [Ignavibacteria bacterium]
MKFVKKAVKRFMPGETEDDAIVAAKNLLKYNIPTTFTHLGENISSIKEAEENTEHYINVLDKISECGLDTEISVKLTQLGFDQSFDKSIELFSAIADKAQNVNNKIMLDIEDSSYVDGTISFYKLIKEKYDNVGLCLQAYLYRTMEDIKSLTEIDPWIRLVKGAYKEPESVAFRKFSDVNSNYLLLSKYLLITLIKRDIRTSFATHDLNIHNQIKSEAKKIGIESKSWEFQMLYGIKTGAQHLLATEGYKIRTLVSYGEHWYPW